VRLRSRRTASSEGTKLLFATDIHGSDRCFRKFLNGAKFYGVDHIILGGDITGKVLVPIENRNGRFVCEYNDKNYVDLDEREKSELEAIIRDNGQYPIVGERDELVALSDEATRDRVFRKVVAAGIERWVHMAEDRLGGTGVRCFITPGNDDFTEVDEALQGSDVVEYVEGRRVRLDEFHEMITTGYSNPTPWDSPREMSEADLKGLIDAMMKGADDPASTVMVIHPPPFNTQLDQAPEIDEEFRVQVSAGAARLAAVGSTAVREAIEEYQPVLGLHGHVHDSKAVQHIGRTLCVNPGSEYTNGTLLCAIVNIRPGVVKAQFMAG
jgi:uncharacterized protein